MSSALDAICLLVAGVIRARLPADEFTLAWRHSVEKTRWEERYRIDGDRLALVMASVQGMGAGMEPPAGATLENGTWTWHPQARLSELVLAHSSFVRDYDVCFGARCSTLGTIVGDTYEQSVTVRACAREK